MKMKKGKKPIGMLMFLTVAVSLAMVLGLMPGMSLTAYADDTIFNPASTYTGFEALKNGDDSVTIKEVPEKEWYVIGYDSEAGTVTLLSKQSFGDQAFNSDSTKGNDYSNSEIKSYVEGLTAVGKPLVGINDALVGEPYLLSSEEASLLSDTKRKLEGINWWLRSPGSENYYAEYVCQYCGKVHDNNVRNEYGVRPAIKLNLSSVIFKSESGSYSFEVNPAPAGYTVTYKVANGTWEDGTTEDKTENVASGSKPANVPTGMKASEGYTGGSWDLNPADVTITEAKTFTYTFTAKQPTPQPTETGIKLNASELTITQGRENALKATTVPEGASVTWTSSDNSVATVDASGVVKGIKVGTATITAKITVDEKDYTASCKVTVVASGTPTINPSGTPKIIPSSGGGEHVHKYVWDTIEATEDADGELRYQCEICGDIKERVPLTAYNVFNKNTTEKIRKAPKNATVKIETSKWISFHKMVMEALAERPDVTLEISFLDEGYKGNRCTVIIPKGTDVMSLVDKNGFTGFLYLGGKFG
nr:Ig-like domain-containing protein [Butyrivibrio sp.]